MIDIKEHFSKPDVSNKRRVLYIVILIVLLKIFNEVKPYTERRIDQLESYQILYFLMEMFFVLILVFNLFAIMMSLLKRTFAYTGSKYEILDKFREYQKERE